MKFRIVNSEKKYAHEFEANSSTEFFTNALIVLNKMNAKFKSVKVKNDFIKRAVMGNVDIHWQVQISNNKWFNANSWGSHGDIENRIRYHYDALVKTYRYGLELCSMVNDVDLFITDSRGCL